MKFRTASVSSVPNGRLDYSTDDQAFEFEPRSDESVTSLLINDLQIEVDENGRLLYCWGLCPYSVWEIKEIEPPEFHEGAAFLNAEKITPGISKSVTGSGRWPVFVNLKSRWIMVGEPLKQNRKLSAIEFVKNTLVVFSNENELIALWLRPEHLPI